MSQEHECEFCQRVIMNKGSLKAHEMSCKKNPNRTKHFHSPNAGLKPGCIPYNKGKKRDTPAWNKGLTGLKGTPHTEEMKKHLSEVAKNRKLGGYVPGSGRGKKGKYKGFYCDSSWELAYIIYCLEHNIQISRNTEYREYIFNDKKQKYLPDFWVDGSLIEIKGYKTEQWEAKAKYNPDVIVLYEKDLKYVFDYVVQKYGRNYINLYESKD